MPKSIRELIIKYFEQHPAKGKHLLAFALTVILITLVSQLSSYLISTYLAVGETIKINSFIWLTHVRNYGGIFGSFPGRGWLFAILAFCFLTGLMIYLIQAKTLKFYHYICFGLIMGGGNSNILDRLFYGAVIDFINIQHIPYWKYIFNTADSMIHLGIWPMLLLTWLGKNKQQRPTAGISYPPPPG